MAFSACALRRRGRAQRPTTAPPIKRRRCSRQLEEPFNANVAFSLQGKGFWADLSQGLMNCDLVHTTGDPALPAAARECRRLDLETDEKVMDYYGIWTGQQPMKLYRTMGVVGFSIWFVSIDVAKEVANDTVKMWALELRGPGKSGEARWEKAEELLGVGHGFKAEGLPEWPLEHPALTPDGDLCVVLSAQNERPRRGDRWVDDMCVFDVRGRRLLWHGLVLDYPFFFDHVVVPSDFLRRKHGSRERRSTNDTGRRQSSPH
uniref:DUF1618 domain-containing protein n=1 Tax=Setaria viridis TaxID=4556 RepID=A0A4U6SSG3_SETVI|nr:hypothetical protein SEVIR_9G053800v2 [Setaria viridis]